MEQKMFCYQCQETAGTKGCTYRGVCGKLPQVANLQDAAIEMSKILAYWNTKARKFEKTNKMISHHVVKTLFATITNANFDGDWFERNIRRGVELRNSIQSELHDEVQAQKFPKSVFWSPLVDDQWNRQKLEEFGEHHSVLSEPNEDLRSLKELTFYGLKGLAAYYDHALVLGYEDEEILEFIELTLSQYIDGSSEIADWIALTLKTGEFGVKTMALLDNANVETFGKPEPTSVNLGIKEGPGILISGHDLLDLFELLQQTAGKGINVYTHGEMLPANAYPKLKEFPHLVGNYGGSWWHQNKEFQSFNGPILMTTNCIVPPKKANTYQLFTTGNAGFPGATHIGPREPGKQKDFSSVIEAALKTSTPTQLEEKDDKQIMIGFAHDAVLSRANDVVNLIKSGDIRRFVVMAGCDGRRKSRGYFTEVAQNLPDDTIILTAGCAKYRYNKLDLGDIKGIPRVLDAGQCNDSYSLAVVALKLAEVFEKESVNDLPLSFDIAWYEQKAVIVLLALLHLGVKNIRLGPTLPAFLSPNVINVLVEKFNIMPIGSVEEDIDSMMAGN